MIKKKKRLDELGTEGNFITMKVDIYKNPQLASFVMVQEKNTHSHPF